MVRKVLDFRLSRSAFLLIMAVGGVTVATSLSNFANAGEKTRLPGVPYNPGTAPSGWVCNPAATVPCGCVDVSGNPPVSCKNPDTSLILIWCTETETTTPCTSAATFDCPGGTDGNKFKGLCGADGARSLNLACNNVTVTTCSGYTGTIGN